MRDCTNLFTVGLCKSFGVPLTLTTVWDGNSKAAYSGPQFQAHLDLLGLGDIAALPSLTIYVIQKTPIPENITLSFLPKLRFVQSSVIISECARENRDLGACDSSPTFPEIMRLTGITAFNGVQRLGSFLQIFSGGFVDMTSFSSLTCPPARLLLANMPYLVSLDGLDNIAPWSQDDRGPSLIIGNNPGLSSPASIAALRPYLLCFQGSSSLRGDRLTLLVPNCAENVGPSGLRLSRSLTHGVTMSSVCLEECNSHLCPQRIHLLHLF
jgi:hypothetical protein